MKNCKPRWVKTMIDWAERELTAVMAVAIVLAFIFSQSLASDEKTAESLVSTSTGSAIISQQISQASTIWETGSLIEFGKDLTGVTDSSAVYSGVFVNLGKGLFAPAPASVTISTVPGTYSLKVIAENGTVTIGKVPFKFTGFAAITKSVTVGSQMTVLVTGNTKIYSIEAVTPVSDELSPDSNGSSSTIVPLTAINILPSIRSIIIGTSGSSTFLVVVKNSLGAVVSNVPLIWSSSDPTIASVDENGVVTPIKAGTVTITAMVSGSALKASASVTALPPVTLPTIDVTPAEPAAESFLDKLAKELTGDQTIETPKTDGNEDAAQTALDKLAGDAIAPTTGGATNETTGNGGITTEPTETTLDAFASAQAASYVATGSTQVPQATINNIVNAQPTVGKKIAARATLAIKQISNTFTEIFVGRKIEVGGQTITKPSLWKIIGNFIKGKTSGAGATEPGTMGFTPDDEDVPN